MPRPKVLPANRLRAPEACLACRASKKRCSGTFPCTKCVRNGRADTCVPFRRSNSTSTPRQTNNLYKALNPHVALDARPETRTSLSVGHDRLPQLLPAAPATSGAPHKTHFRMLRNRQGERVYIGRAASLSFLQLLRDTVTQHIGPSQFSHNGRSEDMLETDTPDDIPQSFQSDLNASEEQAYIRTYHIATSGFINVLSDMEARQMVGTSPPTNGTSNKTTVALRDIMIAIGAQSSKNNVAITRVERYFFTRAQQCAFAGMLENPSLDLIRLFILMSFYMLGACRRNAAFMYLGVAARAAAALGLHLTDYTLLELDEQQKRTRIWMSLCTLDLLVSSILGRPPATASLRPEVTDTETVQSTRAMDDSLAASYSMALILNEIVSRLYDDKAASTEVAEALLDKLKQWSNDLPDSLLSSPSTLQERLAAQEHIIGSLHIACAYHFAVIIVTRPFLISVLGVRLARLHQDSPGIMQDETILEDPAHTTLANACVESALYMIQTCVEVHQSCLLLGNMCILKALVFAAALIPGFSMFSQKEVDSTLEEAFNGALEILRVLSQQSAQAAHYFEILNLLRNAIDEQRQRLREHPPPDKKYVSKLFSLNNRRNNSPQPQRSLISAAEPSAATDPGSVQSFTVDTPYPDPEGASFLFQSADDPAAFPGCEGMELPLWDRFPFIDDSLLN
ncbi:Zn(II)2Cys6 transcription factor [Aspergillus lucknowensis]|uniref:Fungal-specific transcription factor domain-containing protein n=1 Tax=Aspergillus lucknowensis TaxID=176173 RepID=A0ABR4LX99_9EURO